MEKENILFAEEKITEKEKEENIKGEKHIFCDFMILTFFLSLYWRRFKETYLASTFGPHGPFSRTQILSNSIKFNQILFNFIHHLSLPVHCYQLTYFNRFSGWDFVMTSPLFHVWHRMFAPYDSTLQILNSERILSLPCWKKSLNVFPIGYKCSNISEY